MKRLRDSAVPVVFCLVGLGFAFQETILSGFRLQRHDLGDTRFVSYALEHELRWLLGSVWHSELFNRPFFFPAENVGAYADVYVGALPFYAPLRIFFEYDTAFLAYGFVVSAANFAAMYLLLRRGGRFSQVASGAGAALFAFANTRMNMAMHWQMFPHYWSVITVFCLWALTEELSPRKKQVAIAVGILSIAGQLWSSYYLGWFLLFGLTVALPPALAFKRVREPILRALWDHRFVTIASVAAAALLLFPLARAYLASAKEAGMRPFGEVMTMVPMPQSWLNMGPESFFYGKLQQSFPSLELNRIPMAHEQHACIGFVSFAIALAGAIVGRKKPGVVIAAVALVLIMVFSTHLSGKTLWRLVYDLFPGAQAIRAVSRISLLLLLPAGVLLAAALDALATMKRQVIGVGAALVLAAASIGEQAHAYSGYDIAQNRRDVREIVRAVHPKCELFVISPVGDFGPYWKHQLDAMSAQLFVGIPTLNGYSGRAPPGWDLTDVRINNERDMESVEKRLTSWIEYSHLEDFRICHVLVGYGTPELGARFESSAPLSFTATPGAPLPVHFKVTNTGTDSWAADGRFLLALQFDRDQRAAGGPAAIPMPREVKPGETVELSFTLPAPQQPGAYALQFRMVDRQRGWFGALPEPVRIELFSAPAPQ